jgi:hypothetical protein
VQGHGRLVGRALLELLFQLAGVLADRGQARLAQSGAWEAVLLIGSRNEFDHGQRSGLCYGEL